MPVDATRPWLNEVDVNRDGRIDENELRQLASGALDGNIASSAFITNREPRYPTDSRGFFLDPNPEIFIRPDPSPAPTYTQNITIRYLQPPPLPPAGENIIREVRAPPLQAPPPLLIREPGRPGYQPPALVLREYPPDPPPVIPTFETTVNVPPLPAPPQSTVTEKFADLPDRPRDIILERWLPYEPRTCPRTVRIPAASGPLPTPPRNRIIQYQRLEARITRHFQRLGVTRTDPEAYIQRYGTSLLDSATFLREARAAGVVEDISPSVVDGAGFSGEFDVVGTARLNADTNNDGTLRFGEFYLSAHRRL